MEEVTEENIKKLINKIPKDCDPLERVVLANEGTVQTLMSVLFGVPIKVEVISQIELSSVIVRWARLIADYGSGMVITVCLAESVIDKSTSYNGFMNGIREKNSGIGQLLSACCIKTTRELLGFYSDSSIFSRTYRISGGDSRIEKEVSIIITEVFQKDAFKMLNKACKCSTSLNFIPLKEPEQCNDSCPTHER